MAWQRISDVAKELTRHSINFYKHVIAGLCSHKINKFDGGGEGWGTVQGSVNVNLQPCLHIQFNPPDFSSDATAAGKKRKKHHFLLHHC